MSKTILVVEDETDTATFLTTLLEDNGYTTITAGNGQEGLKIARDQKPDLITLDLMMPDQSGTDFYRKLSRDKELSGTPVIVVSGTPGRHLAVKNPAAVFDKPIKPDAFLAAVKKALE